jgi:hypothetical protein
MFRSSSCECAAADDDPRADGATPMISPAQLDAKTRWCRCCLPSIQKKSAYDIPPSPASSSDAVVAEAGRVHQVLIVALTHRHARVRPVQPSMRLLTPAAPRRRNDGNRPKCCCRTTKPPTTPPPTLMLLLPPNVHYIPSLPWPHRAVCRPTPGPAGLVAARRRQVFRWIGPRRGPAPRQDPTTSPPDGSSTCGRPLPITTTGRTTFVST